MMDRARSRTLRAEEVRLARLILLLAQGRTWGRENKSSPAASVENVRFEQPPRWREATVL